MIKIVMPRTPFERCPYPGLNEAHRYFTAEADINGNKLREL